MALVDATTKLRKLVDLCEEVDALITSLSEDPLLGENPDWKFEVIALNLGDFREFARSTGIELISAARGGPGMLQTFIAEKEVADDAG